MTSELDLAASLFGSRRLETSNERRSSSSTSTLYGTAVSDSADGSVDVVIDGGSVSAAMPDGTEGDNVLTLATSPAVKEGDTVLITAVGGASKQMTVTAVVASGDRNRDAAAAADGWNPLIRETADGVEVGKSADGETYAGAHVLLSGDSLTFLDADGNMLADYKTDAIFLGKNSASSVIDLCDGSGTLSQYKDGGIALQGERAVISSQSPVGVEKYGQAFVFATSKGEQGDASKTYGGEVTLRATAATQDGRIPPTAGISIEAFSDRSSAARIYGDQVSINGADACSAVSLYSNSTGSISVTLSTYITIFNYLMICIKNAQGAHHWVVAKAEAGECPFETHGVTDDTMWVVFGALSLSLTKVEITSQVNMPITGYEFGIGTGNIDCRIVAVRGCY